MKQLEGKKRNDDRDRKREELKVEKERERERKIEQKRLETEIVAEMRKPVEDMAIPEEEHKEMPKLSRIPHLKLSGEAFANVLMVHEFLHNFGERLGFDMESLPTLADYQVKTIYIFNFKNLIFIFFLKAALLFDPEAEEELLSVLIHLLVCAIDHPGIPFPHRHLTILGQNLRQADITNTNVSEILKIYLRARAVIEVKNLHGVLPPDAHITRDKTVKDQPVCQEKMDEYQELLHNTRAYEMSNWVADKPFLCLNATEKSEMLAFVCNELLFNKSVQNEIENTMERGHSAKKVKMMLETKIKKLKTIYHRKYKYLANNAANANTHHEEEEKDNEDEDRGSVAGSEATSEVSPVKKGKKKKTKKTTKSAKSKKKQNYDDNDEENDMEVSEEEHEEELEEDDGEDDEKLGPEELQKKIEKFNKRLIKQREDVIFLQNCLRVNDLGQDRFRRRYWHFAHAGGVFVEAMESAEPWKVGHKGMPHVKKEFEDENEGQSEEEIDDEEPMDVQNEEIHEKKPKIEDEEKENVEEALKKLGESDVTVTPKVEKKDIEKLVQITPNGDKVNLFNHSSQLNMSLSPMVLNGAVTITPKTPQQQFNNIYNSFFNEANNKAWFSVLPLNKVNEDHSSRFEKLRREAAFKSPEDALLQNCNPVNPQIALLELKLEQLKKSSISSKDRKPIPADMSRSWWRITDPDQVVHVEKSLHIRGAREQLLLQNMKRSMDFCQMETKKALGEADLGLEALENSEDEDEEEEEVSMFGADVPPPDVPGKWSKEVALRVDKYVLEQVEALEDKVAAASMQVPVRNYLNFQNFNFNNSISSSRI